MNVAAIQALRAKLRAGVGTYGVWITLEAPSLTEMAVAVGLDWIVIDAEHGHLDWQAIVAHLRCTVRSRTVALVRLAELNGGLIKRALDIGADGILIPWAETPAQLTEILSWAHYPPQGRRGIGAERATAWGRAFTQHVDEARENTLIVPIIESVRAGHNIAAMCQVPGIDLFQVGPADWSSTAGYAGQWEGPGVADQILKVVQTIRQHGKHCGIIATSPENLLERARQGFQLLGVGLDSGLFLRGLSTMLAPTGRELTLNTTLTPPT